MSTPQTKTRDRYREWNNQRMADAEAGMLHGDRYDAVYADIVDAIRQWKNDHGIEHSPDLAALGLPASATLDEVQAAYRKAAVEAHPDRGGSHEAMVRLNEAYEAARRVVGE